MIKWIPDTPTPAGGSPYPGMAAGLESAMGALLILCMLSFSESAAGLDWSVVEPDSGELILRAPGIPDTPEYLQRATEHWNIFEFGNWKAAGADLPEAQLILIRMKDIAPSNRHFVKTDPVSAFARLWFPDESLVMGHAGRVENALGELDSQRFRRPGNIECMGVEQGISTYSDAIDFDSGAELLGDKIIRGWYCVPAGTRNVEQVLAAFVTGIGLKGFADPSRDSQVSIQIGEVHADAADLISGKSDADLCAGVRYGHPDYVAEAKRRGWPQEQCRSAGSIYDPPVAPTASRTRADGAWKGRMICGKCSDCPAPLEKNVSITIESGQFEFIPDTSYMGKGEIDADDTVRVWWEGYGTTSRKIFRFEGRLLDNKIELEGYRGPRTCRISLSRISDSDPK